MRGEGTWTERFWAKVRKTPGCWFWEGGYGNGQPSFYWRGKVLRARRVMCALAANQWPTATDYVTTTCGVARCVRPEHLQVGTRGIMLKVRHQRRRKEGVT